MARIPGRSPERLASRSRLLTPLLLGALVVMPVSAAQIGDSELAELTDQRTKVTRAGDIAENPHRFLGERVIVEATVEDIYSPAWFSLDEDKVWTTGRDVLVLNPRPDTRVTADTEVTVVGEVRMFTEAEVHRFVDTNDLRLRPDLVVLFEERPVVIAESIRTEDHRELVRPLPESERAALVVVDDRPGRDAPVVHAERVKTGDIRDDLQDHLGSTVFVESEVEKLYSRSVFEVDDDVIVIAPGLRQPVLDDMDVVIIGQVTRFSPDVIERQITGYRLDLLPEATRELIDRPVLIARSVRTAAGEELVGSGQ